MCPTKDFFSLGKIHYAQMCPDQLGSGREKHAAHSDPSLEFCSPSEDNRNLGTAEDQLGSSCSMRCPLLPRKMD